MRELCIGNVRIPGAIALGPMAGVTDRPFRRLCREQGAGLLVTEMVSAKAILYHNRGTEKLLATDEAEYPIAVQLFGSEPEILAEAAEQIADRPFAVLDLNMGCPVPKIVNNGEGSALLRDPKRAAHIVEAITRRIDKPVTVKIRRGFSAGEDVTVEMAKRLEAAGAAAITVHGRTREQMYAGTADWDCIRRAKEAVKIPVIGNGDVDSPEAAEAMFRETGCDGIMVARAARGNPWIFRQIRIREDEAGIPADADMRPVVSDTRAQAGAAIPPGTPTEKERHDTILRHMEMLIAEKGEYIGIREMRKHIAWYTAGLPGAAAARRRLNEMEEIGAIRSLVDELFRV